MTREIPRPQPPPAPSMIVVALRGCLCALLLWAALTAVYLLVLSRFVVGDDLVVAPFLSLVGVWLGSAIWTCAAGTEESRSLRRALRGDLPRDGEPIAALGVIVPEDETLEAPLTGRTCVAYEYGVFTMVRSGVDDELRRKYDYSGFRRVPFVLRTATGDVAVYGFGSLDHLREDELSGDEVAARARAWVARTELTPFDRGIGLGRISELAQGLAEARSARADSRGVDASLAPDRRFAERILPSGVAACAFGRYSAERSGVVSTLGDPVTLHLGTGPQVRAGLATQRRGHLWLALVLFVLTHGGYAAYLRLTLG